MAMRTGNLKYQDRKYVSHQVDPLFAVPLSKGPWLFNLDHDPAESYDLLSGGVGSPPAIADQFNVAKRGFDDNPRGWRSMPGK